MQKGHGELELEFWFSENLDLKSEGRLARAGENMTHRLLIGSFRSSGLLVSVSEDDDDAIMPFVALVL